MFKILIPSMLAVFAASSAAGPDQAAPHARGTSKDRPSVCDDVECTEQQREDIHAERRSLAQAFRAQMKALLTPEQAARAQAIAAEKKAERRADRETHSEGKRRGKKDRSEMKKSRGDGKGHGPLRAKGKAGARTKGMSDLESKRPRQAKLRGRDKANDKSKGEARRKGNAEHR